MWLKIKDQIKREENLISTTHYSIVVHPYLLPFPTLQVDIAPIELKELTKFSMKIAILPLPIIDGKIESQSKYL